MAYLTKYMSKTFTTHQVKIEEVENGLKITETFDTENVISFISFHAKPFLRSTNETEIDSFQILDLIGEIYNIPALATEFILIDLKGAVYIPGNATELIEYSVKLKPFRSFYEQDEVLAIGEITADSSTVTVGLSSTGKNSVRINGSIYDRYILSDFPFIPVVEFTKILIVYAKPDSTVFYLAQGVEALSAVEPDYEGLFVARLIVNVSGIVIEEGGNNGDVLVKNGNSQEWSPRLTEAEQELVTIETRLDDLNDNDNSLKEQITAETTARENADIAESNARTFADGVLDSKITAEKNRNDSQDSAITDLGTHQIIITTTTSITTNTVGTVTGKGQHGRNVRINNGVNAINITVDTSSDANFIASYHKLGSADVTFVAGSGATLVQIDGTAVMTGTAGKQTACIERNGNTFYLQISNR